MRMLVAYGGLGDNPGEPEGWMSDEEVVTHPIDDVLAAF